MWILKKPDLTEAKKDIKVVVRHCNSLNDDDRVLLEQLYDDYNNGGGEVTRQQLLPLDSKKEVIKQQYAKTIGKLSGRCQDNHLVNMRTDLLHGVHKCPYCSINEPEQLDHYMDKSRYGQLAVCRLNLVPLCCKCNNSKRDLPYSDFVHPYYQSFPDADILVADCKIVRNNVVVSWGIDRDVLGDEELADRIESQMKHIQLLPRLQKAMIEFLSQSFGSFNGSEDDELKECLGLLLRSTSSCYGRNDWRTALIRGLIKCPQFDVRVVEEMKQRNVNGVGA